MTNFGCDDCNYTGFTPMTIAPEGPSDFVPCEGCKMPRVFIWWGDDKMRGAGRGLHLAWGLQGKVALGERHYKYYFDIIFYKPVRIYR